MQAELVETAYRQRREDPDPLIEHPVGVVERISDLGRGAGRFVFGQAQGLSFDLDVLAALPGVALLNGLAAALPFQPAEKQALLEAAGPPERQQMLLALMGMGIEPQAADRTYAPPVVN